MLFFALFCTLFSVIFNYTLSIMASPYIVADLGGSDTIATYTVSLFALGNALGLPLGRALFLRIGTVRFLFIAMLLFSFFSWTCAIAPNYPFFNASRFLQGFVSGPFYVLVFHLFSCLQPEGKKEKFTSITLMIFTVVPVIGACWGGWLAYEWTWRLSFYLGTPLLLLLALYLRYRLAGFDTQPPERTPFDLVGYLFYFIAVFSLGIAIITGQQLDWFRSPLITGLFILGTPCLLFYIFWDLNHPHPVIDLKLLKRMVLSFSLFCLAILFSAYFGMVVLLSLWLKLWVNYTPDWIGVLLGIMALTGLLPLSLMHPKRLIDNRIFLATSILLLLTSCFHTMAFNVDIDFQRIAISRALAGLGLSFFLAPLFRLGFYQLQKEQVLPVLGLFQITRALSSGLGACVYDVIWQRRQVFFHERLSSSVTANAQQTQEFFLAAKEVGLEGNFANAQLEYYLQRQATALALDDCFYLMAWILAGLLMTFIFTFFARKGSFITPTPDQLKRLKRSS